MKTSRYANRALADATFIPLGITLGNPRFELGYRLAGNLRLLAPPRSIFGMKDREGFRKLYVRHLEEIGVNAIQSALQRYDDPSGKRELVLLCFEDVFDQSQWCHRRMFAEWWEKATGEVVEELAVTELTEPREPKPEKKKKDAGPQLFLF